MVRGGGGGLARAWGVVVVAQSGGGVWCLGCTMWQTSIRKLIFSL